MSTRNRRRRIERLEEKARQKAAEPGGSVESSGTAEGAMSSIPAGEATKPCRFHHG